jgi:D-proline reductase (dithiol) PrdB
VGLIQYHIEKAGIPTISITHLLTLTKKVRVPRALYLKFPMGRSFGRAGDLQTQRRILLDALTYLQTIESPETVITLPYRWREKKNRKE